MINDHAKQRPFAMKREANETGKQKNGQRRPKCAKLSSGEPAMPVKDIFPLSLVTPAKISRWRRQIDTHLVRTVHVLVHVQSHPPADHACRPKENNGARTAVAFVCCSHPSPLSQACVLHQSLSRHASLFCLSLQMTSSSCAALSGDWTLEKRPKAKQRRAYF